MSRYVGWIIALLFEIVAVGALVAARSRFLNSYDSDHLSRFWALTIVITLALVIIHRAIVAVRNQKNKVRQSGSTIVDNRGQTPI